MSKFDPPSEPPDGDPVCKRCDTLMLDGYAGLNVKQHDWYCPNDNCPMPQTYRVHWKLESNGRKFMSPALLQMACQQMVASLELDDDVIDVVIEKVSDDGSQQTV